MSMSNHAPEEPNAHLPLPQMATVPPPLSPNNAEEKISQLRKLYWSTDRILRAHLLGHGLVFMLFAASMWLQPERYTTANLPSLVYALGELPISLWATLFFIVGCIKLLACWRYPRWARLATSVGTSLIAFLTILFLMAWIWGTATVFLLGLGTLDIGGHLFAMSLLDDRLRWLDKG